MCFTDQGKTVTLLSVGSAMSTANEIRNRYPEAFAATPTRYRLDVVASSVEDVIVSAGGWLFDRAMAGWKVNLLITEPSDARPLEILGISALPLEKAFEPVANWPPTQAIAVAADVFNSDQRVRGTVVAALDRGLTEVTLWGDSWPPGFHRRADAVQHRLSAAARAFKAHALSAAQLPSGSITEAEEFRSGSRWTPPYERDLVPIG
jgi:hypothetical protein